jgi:hypothetical protein
MLTRGRRKPGSQGERGIGPRFIGRTSVTTTIGNCLRSNKMIKKNLHGRNPGAIKKKERERTDPVEHWVLGITPKQVDSKEGDA